MSEAVGPGAVPARQEPEPRPGEQRREQRSAVEEPVSGRHGMFGVTGTGDTSGFGGLVVRRPALASTPRPYGGWFDNAYDALEAAVPDLQDAIERALVDRGELTLTVRRERLIEVATALRNAPELRFEMLACLSGVDFPAQERRLHSVAHLRSLTHRRVLRLEVAVSVEDPHMPSLTGLYPGANWQEREAWDFFGIIYDGHPGLTRIEMPDDWPGHPQRKDYPLGGVPVEYKGAQVPPPDERRAYA